MEKQGSVLQLPISYISTKFIKEGSDNNEVTITLPKVPGSPDKFVGATVWLVDPEAARLVTELSDNPPVCKTVKAVGSEGVLRVTFRGIPEDMKGKLVLVVVPNA